PLICSYPTGVIRLDIIHWTFSQLTSYGLWAWLLFVAIAFIPAYFLRLRGIILGHILVAIIVVLLDLRWIQSEMHKPDWNGQPDQDIVFMIGAVLRILLINTALLPLSIVA